MEDEMSVMPTFHEINERNRRFWEEENALRDRRMEDEVIREAAFARLFDEQARGVPVRNQATIEKLLADVEAESRRFASERAREAGRAKEADALQQAILDLVRKDPGMTAAKLKDMLTRERFPGLIEDVDEETIGFRQPDRSKDGRLKGASISGLKDRLSRAKKTLKSR